MGYVGVGLTDDEKAMGMTQAQADAYNKQKALGAKLEAAKTPAQRVMEKQATWEAYRVSQAEYALAKAGKPPAKSPVGLILLGVAGVGLMLFLKK